MFKRNEWPNYDSVVYNMVFTEGLTGVDAEQYVAYYTLYAHVSGFPEQAFHPVCFTHSCRGAMAGFEVNQRIVRVPRDAKLNEITAFGCVLCSGVIRLQGVI